MGTDEIDLRKNESFQICTTEIIDFDYKLSSWLIKLMLKDFSGYLDVPKNEREKYENIISAIAYQHAHSKLVMPDGRIFLKQRGLINGAKEYPFLAAKINYFYTEYAIALQQLKAPMNNRPPVLYDQVVKGSSTMFVASNIDFDEYKRS